MKVLFFSIYLVSIAKKAVFARLASSASSSMFQLEVTNGSGMPIAPGVIYSTIGEETASPIGSTPTPGFVKLCSMGDPSIRFTELESNPVVRLKNQTAVGIAPGQSLKIPFSIQNVKTETLHFEAMYGKTRDSCAVITVTTETLTALGRRGKWDSTGHDQVISAGFWLDPAIPSVNSTSGNVCANQTSAVGCLRSLTVVNTIAPQVRFFPGYLPSVVTAIENAYGAAQTQALIIPTSGAVYYHLTKLN